MAKFKSFDIFPWNFHYQKNSLFFFYVYMHWLGCTLVQNSLVLRHLKWHFPMCLGVSERSSEQTSECRGAREQGGQCRANKGASSMSKWAKGQASGPVLTSQFLAVLNHCGVVHWNFKTLRIFTELHSKKHLPSLVMIGQDPLHTITIPPIYMVDGGSFFAL